MEEGSQMVETVGGIIFLLLVGAIILATTKRIKLPFTVALVLAGMGLAKLADSFPELLAPIHDLKISPDLILYVFLPTLVFESAFNLDARQLRRNLGAVMALAVPGLLLSTFIIGGLIGFFTAIPYPAAFLLGSILSATDPVSVIALFKQLGAPQRLTILVEGESLFNDATSIVVARLLVGVVLAGTVSANTVMDGAYGFVVLFIGGLIVGWVLGLLAGFVLGKVESDPFIEITLTTILAYLSFILAEEVLHVSGIMATVGAGVTLGSWGRIKISPSVRHYLENFWEYAAFLANTLIFLMVGLRLEVGALWGMMDYLGLVVAAMLVSRAVVVYGLMPLVGRLPNSEPVDLPYQTVMFWGGLRGAIALAIVLSLPDFEEKEIFISLVMGAVLFTLLVQGLSIEYLMKRLGLATAPLIDRLGRTEVYISAKQRALEGIGQLMKGGLFSGPIAGRLQGNCETEIKKFQEKIEAMRKTELDRDQERRLLYLRGLAEEKSLFFEMLNNGHLSERAFRELLLILTLQIDQIRYHGDLEHGNSQDLRHRRFERWVNKILDLLPGFKFLAERLRLARVAMNYEAAWGFYQGSSRVLDHLDEFARIESTPGEVVEEVRHRFQLWKEGSRTQLDNMAEQFPEFVNTMQERLGLRLILLANAETAHERAEHGTLPHGLAEEIQRETDRNLRALRGQEVTKLKIEPIELLRKVPFFREIPEGEFPNLSQLLRARTVAEEEAIMRQGEKGNSLFLIARGVVRVSRESDGLTRDLATLMAGDFFGEMALLHPDPRSASVVAVTPCSLYELRRDDLQKTMETYPAIRSALEETDRRRKAEMARN